MRSVFMMTFFNCLEFIYSFNIQKKFLPLKKKKKFPFEGKVKM